MSLHMSKSSKIICFSDRILDMYCIYGYLHIILKFVLVLIHIEGMCNAYTCRVYSNLSRWWFETFLIFTPHLGKWSNLTSIFLLADGKPFVLFTTFWTCTHVRCYATSGLGVITFLNLNTCRCYATSGLAHMFDATQHLGLHTWLLLRNTMGWGGVGGGGGWGWWCSLGLHTCWMLRNCWCSSGLAHMLDATKLMMFFRFAHMLDATELLMFFRFAHMLDATELLMFFRACTHVGCYGTADVL